MIDGTTRTSDAGQIASRRVGGFLRPRVASRRTANIELRVGLGILAVLIAFVVFGPLLVGHDPNQQDLAHQFASPSSEHWLGTDHLGRDVLARLAYGGRIDLSLATITVVIPLTFGTIVGALAGYFGGWFDLMVMRVADVVAAFPFFVLVITLVFVLGSGVKSIIIAISLVGWIAYARIVRAETLVVRGREYVDACRSGGLPASRIIARHIIPNSASQAVIYAMSDMVLNIGVIVTLSYFGLGITPPTSDWGRMISDGQQFLTSGRYALVLIPGAAVILTSLALSLIGDGLVSILRGKR